MRFNCYYFRRFIYTNFNLISIIFIKRFFLFFFYNSMSIRARNIHFTNWAKVLDALVEKGVEVTTEEEARSFLTSDTNRDSNPFYYYVGYIKESQEIYTHGKIYSCSGNDDAELRALIQSVDDDLTEQLTALQNEVEENEDVIAAALTDLNNNKADKSDFTYDNIKNTLQISDWALGSKKPTYTYSEISGTPTSLKNPYALSWSGSSSGSYDGSSAQSIVLPTNLSQFTDDIVAGNYLPLSGGTVTGTITYSGTGTSFAPIISSGLSDGGYAKLGQVNNLFGLVAYDSGSSTPVSRIFVDASGVVSHMGDLVPNDSNAYSLGSSTNQYKNSYFSGVLNLTSIVSNTYSDAQINLAGGLSKISANSYGQMYIYASELIIRPDSASAESSIGLVIDTESNVTNTGCFYGVDFETTSDNRLKDFVADVNIEFDSLKQIPKKYYY